jgi:ABC-type sugar transport system substrate-binding protein
MFGGSLMKKLFVFVSLLVVLSMLAACAPAAAPTAAPAEPTAAAAQPTTAPAGTDVKTVKVCVSWNEKVHSLIQAWQDYMEQYGETYGAENGLKFEWIVNVANGDATQQANNIQDCINQKVDVIVARAQDTGTIGASIEAAKAAGIPFITLDRTSSSGEPTTHVGEDSYLQAQTTARAFAQLLKDNGVEGKCIEVQGDLLDNNAVARHNAYKDVEAETKAWVTIAEVPTEWKAEKFYSGTLNALQAHPEANCLYVASDFAFSSVENALQAVGKLAPTGDPNHIWVAAEDVNPQGYTAMLKKYIDVGTTWEAYDVSVMLVQTIGKIAKGETVDPQNLIAGRLATPATVDTLEHLYAKEYKD